MATPLGSSVSEIELTDLTEGRRESDNEEAEDTDCDLLLLSS